MNDSSTWPQPAWSGGDERARREYYQTHRDELDWEDAQPVAPLRRLASVWSTPIHRHGVAWDEMPAPHRWLRWAHHCSGQTHYWQTAQDGVERKFMEWCRCGGLRVDHGPWTGRFSR